MIVSQLQQMGKWKWVKGPIAGPIAKGNPVGYDVLLGESSTPRHFDVVVLRHGPTPALREGFSALWDACEGLRERWKTVSPAKDVTRKPLPWGSIFERRTEIHLAPEAPPSRPGTYRAVAFDVDGTLLQGDRFKWSWKLVWRHLRYSEDMHLALMSRYLHNIRSGKPGWQKYYDEWCAESAVLFRQKGLKRSHFAEITADLRPVKGMVETLTTLKSAGLKLLIISGGIDQFVDFKLADVKSMFDRIHINKFRFNDDDFQRVETTRYDFHGKVDAVQDFCRESRISMDEVVFVGDGFNDTAMHKKVGLTVCFNSTDSEMEVGADVRIPVSNDPDLTSILPYIIDENIPAI